MPPQPLLRRVCAAFVACALAAAAAAHAADPFPTAGIAKALGVEGVWRDDRSAFQITMQRPDVGQITGGAPVPPFLDLRHTLDFKPSGEGRAVLDMRLLLVSDEVKDIKDRARQLGLGAVETNEVFFFRSPKVYTVRFSGEGIPADLAARAHSLVQRISEIRAANTLPAGGEAYDAGPPPQASGTATPTVDPAEALRTKRAVLRAAHYCLLCAFGVKPSWSFDNRGSGPAGRGPQALGYSAGKAALGEQITSASALGATPGEQLYNAWKGSDPWIGYWAFFAEESGKAMLRVAVPSHMVERDLERSQGRDATR